MSAWPLLFIVTGSLLWVVSGFIWATRRDARARAKAIAGLSTSEVSNLVAGKLVALRGRLEAMETHLDPYTQEQVSYSAWTLSRMDRKEPLLCKERQGRLCRFTDESGCVSIELSDDDSIFAEAGVEESEEKLSTAMEVLWHRGMDNADTDTPEERELPRENGDARYLLEHCAIGADEMFTLIAVPTLGEEGLMLGAPGSSLMVDAATLSEIQDRELADERTMGIMLAIGALVGAVALGAVLVNLF